MVCCRICGSDDRRRTLHVAEMMYGTRRVYEYFQCGECGTLQIEHSETDSANLYPATYYSLARDPSRLGLKQRVKRLVFRAVVARELGEQGALGVMLGGLRDSMEARALKGIAPRDGPLLDVGCGTGYLIEALAGLGYRGLTGVEPHIAADIEGTGFHVIRGQLQDLERSAKYALIMMHHSFEHMEDPDAVLDCVRDLLAPGGICLIRVPVCDSEAFEEYGEHWAQLDAPRHVFLYTNRSIELLARRHGLRIREVRDDSTEFQFVASEQYRRGIPLVDSRSYYRSPLRRILGSSVITGREARAYAERARALNLEGRGDQRAYYLVRDDLPSADARAASA